MLNPFLIGVHCEDASFGQCLDSFQYWLLLSSGEVLLVKYERVMLVRVLRTTVVVKWTVWESVLVGYRHVKICCSEAYVVGDDDEVSVVCLIDCTDWRLKWLARHEGWFGYCFSNYSGAGRYQDYS